MLGLYEREVRFYTDIAPHLGGPAGRSEATRGNPVAPCYHAAGFDSDTGAFHLLLGDAGPAVVGDEIHGATIEQATLALGELGRLHAPLLGDTALANAWPESGITDEPGADAAADSLCAMATGSHEHREVCKRLVAGFDAYLARRPHRAPPGPRPQ